MRIDGKTPGGNRTRLSEVIPLSTPYIVQIFPVYRCNFKCNYCIHSIPEQNRRYISSKSFLDFELYKKCIDDLCKFPKKIKMLRFAGTGEPLLHKDIAEMVKYAVKKQIASSIDIVTNGLLLTKKLSKELVNSGLSRLRISIQGVNSEKYRKVSGVNLNFDKFIQNLSYIYENKGKTQIYIKIIDCALDEGDEQNFFKIFGNICDTIAIEHVLPAVSQIDYSSIDKNSTKNLTQNGIKLENVEICPQPFYLMQINPDGNIVPCCSMETCCILGNCSTESLYDIWNNNRYNNFRKAQLLKQRKTYPICNKCNEYKYAVFPEDKLDNDAEKLLKLFK
ncbi:radical SAM/SPASM domain-containing protein [Clostridium tyrobutyricum]|uniref:radical SAM/SPASM domain-containing protein n=1 Tax=Clostridium tyrobutyricum TaxID=1519 RepID=UPI0034A0B2D4